MSELTTLLGGKVYHRDRLLDIIRQYGPVIQVLVETKHKYRPKVMVEQLHNFEHARDAEGFLRTFYFYGVSNRVTFKSGATMLVVRDRKCCYIWTYRPTV